MIITTDLILHVRKAWDVRYSIISKAGIVIVVKLIKMRLVIPLHYNALLYAKNF